MSKCKPVPLSFVCVQPDDAKCSDAPPIVFLHGLSRFKANWEHIPHHVANVTKRKVYVIDARNHGDTEWCDEFNFDCNVDDLLHFLDYVGAPKAVLVGHSMGGTTAIKTALRAPERVEKVVLEDISVRQFNQQSCDQLAGFLRLMGRAVQEVPPNVDESTAKSIIGKYFMEHFPYAGKMDKKDYKGVYQLKRKSDGHYYHSFNVEGLVKAFEQKAEVVNAENTGQFCGPALFIYGDKSPLQVGNDEEITKKFFPNAEFVKVEGAGHEIHTEFSTEFTTYLLDFLNK